MSTANGSTPSEFYGRTFGKKFGAEAAPFARTLNCAEAAVTELCVTDPSGRLSDPIPCIDAYMVSLLLLELPRHAYWEDGRQVAEISLRAGQTTIHDLKRQPAVILDKKIHSIVWYMPCATLNAVADQANVSRISELRYEPGGGTFDKTIERIGLTFLPAIRSPERVNRLFTDFMMMAFAVHVAQAYGGLQTTSELPKGGLSPWQEKRAKELIASDLSGATPLREVAAACGISVGHFSRAFSKSTGVAPHAWLLQARVDAAKSMLRNHDLPLSEIASSCGFADRSHFTRVFKRHVGQSPGAWRRIMLPT